MTVNKYFKPWGHYTDFYRTEDCVLKEIVVDPKQRLSLQYHEKRGEFWYVRNGEGILQIDKSFTRIVKGDFITIEPSVKHRIINDTPDPCVIMELQFGIHCDENDIVRLEDDYNRIE